jgi:LPPG:FO 2-phospho-L-lactate transferase
VKITVLVGGVGGAKFLLGVKQFLGWQAYGPPQTTFGAPEGGEPWEYQQPEHVHEVTAIVNTADDIRLHNLQICPDLDSCMYTLAGASDLQRGWGRRDET